MKSLIKTGYYSCQTELPQHTQPSKRLTSPCMCSCPQVPEQLHRGKSCMDSQVVITRLLEAGRQLLKAGAQLPVQFIALSGAPHLRTRMQPEHSMRMWTIRGCRYGSRPQVQETCTLQVRSGQIRPILVKTE